MPRGRRTRQELRAGQAAQVAREAREDALRLIAAWGSYEAAQGALESIRQCDAHWLPDDVAPARCDRLAGHPDGHRHRVQGSQVVVTW